MPGNSKEENPPKNMIVAVFNGKATVMLPFYFLDFSEEGLSDQVKIDAAAGIIQCTNNISVFDHPRFFAFYAQPDTPPKGAGYEPVRYSPPKDAVELFPNLK